MLNGFDTVTELLFFTFLKDLLFYKKIKQKNNVTYSCSKKKFFFSNSRKLNSKKYSK